MTADEQGPDTAAIRASYSLPCNHDGRHRVYSDLTAVCDALDAARTERDTAQGRVVELTTIEKLLRNRLDYTEAKAQQVIDERVAAERTQAAEAAVVTARRDALEQAAAELNHQPVPKWMQNERASTVDWLRARAWEETP